jgi:hypothetical protein
MEIVYKKYESDPDVCNFYCEAMMNIHAWNFWDLKEGVPKYNAL